MINMNKGWGEFMIRLIDREWSVVREYTEKDGTIKIQFKIGEKVLNMIMPYNLET